VNFNRKVKKRQTFLEEGIISNFAGIQIIIISQIQASFTFIINLVLEKRVKNTLKIFVSFSQYYCQYDFM